MYMMYIVKESPRFFVADFAILTDEKTLYSMNMPLFNTNKRTLCSKILKAYTFEY